MSQPATLVLLPGLDGTDVFLRPLVARLPPSIRPRVVQYPVDGPFDYPGLLQHVYEQVADLPQFALFASSFGGPLAVMLAAQEPARVRALVLDATFLRPPRPQLAHVRVATVTPLVWLLRACRRLPVLIGLSTTTAFRRAKAETWRRVPARALAARGRAILGVDVSATLRECRQPILCVGYEDDTVVPRSNADEIVRLQPTAQRVTLPGPHLGMFHHPDALADVVARFLGHTSAAADLVHPRERRAAG